MTKLSERFAGLGYVRKQVKMLTFQSRVLWDITFLVPSTILTQLSPRRAYCTPTAIGAPTAAPKQP